MKRILVTITVLALALTVQIRHQEGEGVECLKDKETGHYNCNNDFGYFVRGDGYFTRYIARDFELESCKQKGTFSIECYYQGK